MKILKHLTLTAAALGFQTIANANDLITLEAIKYYANMCYQAGGVSYISNNNGISWSALDAQEATQAAKHAKSMALINASMSGQKLSDAQLSEYLNTNVQPKAQALENSKTLHCEGGRISKEPQTDKRASSSKSSLANGAEFVADGDWNEANVSGAEYTTSHSEQYDVTGYGRISDSNGVSLFSISAECENDKETFKVSDFITKQGSNYVKAEKGYGNGNEKSIQSIKDWICIETSGRGYAQTN